MKSLCFVIRKFSKNSRIVDVYYQKLISQFSTQSSPTKNYLLRRSKIMDKDVKFREHPIVTRLHGSLFDSIFTDEVLELHKLFQKYNYEIRFAGGPVRDLLMGIKPKDYDFATTATPTQMKEMFSKENIRMINMNGEKHGTITPRINDRENFEITTLRIDVVTDGRHAEVEFTKDWLLDANRRDLTINSMFLGFDGSVYDYFYGYEDLKQKRVRFVGNAETRIREDYLRILRYFRFYGRISEKSDNHEPETLKIISENVDGLEKISGERIWVELKKILYGNFAGDLMLAILDCGLGKYIGLSENPKTDEFKRLLGQKINEIDYHPNTLLSALLEKPEDAVKLHERLKFSAFERDLGYFITQNRDTTKDWDSLSKFQKMCLQTIGKPREMKEFVQELLKYHGKFDLFQALAKWEIPRFPIDGNTLKKNGCPTGKLMGEVINKLKEIWAQNEFKTSQEELLTHLSDIMKDLQTSDGGKMNKKQKLQ